MTKLIERNTTIPTKKTRDLLHRGRQPARRSRSTCCRASGEMARDNRTLGKFHLVGIPPAPRGVPADRGHVRHRRQRHPERLGQGSGHRQDPGDHDHLVVRPRQGRGREDGARGAVPLRRGQAAARGGRRCATRRTRLAYNLRSSWRDNKDKIDAGLRAKGSRGGGGGDSQGHEGRRRRRAQRRALKHVTALSHRVADHLSARRRALSPAKAADRQPRRGRRSAVEQRQARRRRGRRGCTVKNSGPTRGPTDEAEARLSASGATAHDGCDSVKNGEAPARPRRRRARRRLHLNRPHARPNPGSTAVRRTQRRLIFRQWRANKPWEG